MIWDDFEPTKGGIEEINNQCGILTVLVYMVTWIPSIYPLYVSIYTSTMDPMGNGYWLVVWTIFYFSIQLGIVTPTDELIFFRGVGQPPTRISMGYVDTLG